MMEISPVMIRGHGGACWVSPRWGVGLLSVYRGLLWKAGASVLSMSPSCSVVISVALPRIQ